MRRRSSCLTCLLGSDALCPSYLVGRRSTEGPTPCTRGTDNVSAGVNNLLARYRSERAARMGSWKKNVPRCARALFPVGSTVFIHPLTEHFTVFTWSGLPRRLVVEHALTSPRFEAAIRCLRSAPPGQN